MARYFLRMYASHWVTPKVNRALKQSVLDDKQHQNFPLYHNGVTVLCSDATYFNGVLAISNYVVVNGAQSISTFKRVSDRLSSDLRVLAKVVQLRDPELARRITINSNNQNSIRPRDLKSTNEIQLRLREEFKSVMDGEFDLEIKRGQESREGATVITNEEAGRLLLAFEPFRTGIMPPRFISYLMRSIQTYLRDQW